MHCLDLERFLAKITIDGECWRWTAYTDKRDGYGRFGIGRKVFLAHVIAYTTFVGQHSEQTLDHLCRNRWCVNPEHLEPVSYRENTLRGEGIAAQEAKRTHCPHGHEYTDANIIWSGRRRKCRECNRIRKMNERLSKK